MADSQKVTKLLVRFEVEGVGEVSLEREAGLVFGEARSPWGLIARLRGERFVVVDEGAFDGLDEEERDGACTVEYLRSIVGLGAQIDAVIAVLGGRR